MVAGVRIYGGFAGAETVRSHRNFVGNRTILSGEISDVEDPNDNCYHVVSAAGAATTVLDGFTITAGAANGSGNDQNGAGIFNCDASCTVANCLFTDNYADAGGAIYNGNSAAPAITACTFDDNRAEDGAAIYNNAATPAITGSAFTNNQAFSDGTVYNNGSGVILKNCVFAHNSADKGAAAGPFTITPHQTRR